MADHSVMHALDRTRTLEAMNRVLRVAARDNNLFRREAFEAIAAVVATYVEVEGLAVALTEPEEGKRIYATSLTGAALPAFGARLSSEAFDPRGVGWEPCACSVVPIRRPHEEVVVGQLIAVFSSPGARVRAPDELLRLVAELFGETFDRSMALARERRLAMILETSGDAMLAWDEDGRITDANAAAAKLAGASRSELIGASIREILDIKQIQPKASDSTQPARTTLQPRPDAETPIPVSVTMTAVEDDPLVAMHALVRNESQVVSAEREAALHFERVRELERELRTILDNAPLIIFRLDRDTGALKYLNRHAERLLLTPMAEALRRPDFLRTVHRDEHALQAFEMAVEVARSGKVSPPYEARLQRYDGEEIAVRGTIYPLRRPSGEVIAVEGILADVSAEHAARSRVVQADRLSTLGLLAASVAHEINNPASFIVLSLGTMERLLKELQKRLDDASVDPALALLGELRDSINRIVRIVRDLRVFASPASQVEGRTITDVNEVVESAVSLARGKIMERARLVKQLCEVPPVRMDRGRLGQVLVNLLVNATDAMTKDGAPATIIIATRDRAGAVEIVVSDTGAGISKENMNRIWVPFFTTKGLEAGTGLGLSISREIVERFGGKITVESPTLQTEHGPRGSRFVVTLPGISEAALLAGVPGDVSPSSTPSSGGSVLIVEDEAPLANVLAREIGRYHDVDVALSADEALARFQLKRFDVVLCDLRMPGMSGEALYSCVKQRDPDQARAFVFMSGIGFVPEVEAFLSASGRPVLQKPFEPGKLIEVIADVVRTQRRQKVGKEVGPVPVVR